MLSVLAMRAELVEQKKAATELRMQALGIQPSLVSSLGSLGFGAVSMDSLPKFVASTMTLQQSFQVYCCSPSHSST